MSVKQEEALAAPIAPTIDATPVKIEDDTVSDLSEYFSESESISPSPRPSLKEKKIGKKAQGKKTSRVKRVSSGSPRRSARIKKIYGVHPMDLRRSNRLIELAKKNQKKA